MSRIWRQLAIGTNWPILVAVAILCGIGLISIWAHSHADPRVTGDARKQLAFILAGGACMLAMQTVSYQRIGLFAWWAYLLSLALLVYTVLPFVPRSGFLGVREDRGQTNWINFGYINLQPSELVKVSFCMALARYLRFRSNYRRLRGLLPPFALAMVPLLVILKQPDLGTALIFIPILFAMLFAAGARLRHLLAIVGLAAAMAPIAWLAGPAEQTGMGRDLPVLRHLPALVKKYQRDRVYAMFWDDPKLQEARFQSDRAITAFGSGGLSGKGPMNIPVGRGVPLAHNDMIFALIGEQFGFIGAGIVLGAYLVLFMAGIEIAAATREPFGRLLAVGVVAMLAGQTLLNLMVAVRLMPVTGITLPFVSYGGSSMLASLVAVGLLLNVGQNRPLVIANDAFEFDE